MTTRIRPSTYHSLFKTLKKHHHEHTLNPLWFSSCSVILFGCYSYTTIFFLLTLQVPAKGDIGATSKLCRLHDSPALETWYCSDSDMTDFRSHQTKYRPTAEISEWDWEAEQHPAQSNINHPARIRKDRAKGDTYSTVGQGVHHYSFAINHLGICLEQQTRLLWAGMH